MQPSGAFDQDAALEERLARYRNKYPDRVAAVALQVPRHRSLAQTAPTCAKSRCPYAAFAGDDDEKDDLHQTPLNLSNPLQTASISLFSFSFRCLHFHSHEDPRSHSGGERWWCAVNAVSSGMACVAAA